MCLGSIGSDADGSIRIPASFCGAAGSGPGRRHEDGEIEMSSRGRRLLAVAAFVLLPGSATDAQQARRPDPSCVDGEYHGMLAAARRGEPRAIFCAAMYSALRYNNETIDAASRRKARIDAHDFKRQAEALGFRFDRYVFWTMTFDEHIAQADHDLAGGAQERAREALQRRLDYNACSARTGTECMGRCNNDPICLTSCNSGNAWRCDR